MKTWRHYLPDKQLTVSLLVVAVFCFTVFQWHVHLHSADAHDAHHQHEHVTNLHLFNTVVEQDHHGDAPVIDAKPAGILKKQLDDDFLQLLAVLLVVMLLLCHLPIGRRAAIIHTSDSYCSRYRHFIPQLRAPPVNR